MRRRGGAPGSARARRAGSRPSRGSGGGSRPRARSCRRLDPRFAHQVVEDLLERVRELPAGIVAAEAAEVGDVADVVAAPRLVEILDVELLDVEILEAGDRLEHRDRVLAPAAEV